MFQENEVILVILGVIVFILMCYNFSQLKRIPNPVAIFTAYCVFFLGWIFTVLEELWFYELLNFMEHVCYLVSSLMLFKWVLSFTQNKKDINRLNE